MTINIQLLMEDAIVGAIIGALKDVVANPPAGLSSTVAQLLNEVISLIDTVQKGGSMLTNVMPIVSTILTLAAELEASAPATTAAPVTP